jgi:hypothetical protein
MILLTLQPPFNHQPDTHLALELLCCCARRLQLPLPPCLGVCCILRQPIALLLIRG